MHAADINQPFYGQRVFGNASSGVFGKGDWALAVGGGRVRGTRCNSRSSMGRGGLEEVLRRTRERVKPQRVSPRYYR